MSRHRYKTSGTCSREVIFDLIDGKVGNIEFTFGCDGNLKGVAALAEGMDANVLVEKLSGITCENKHTSCPDQLARAVRQAVHETMLCQNDA